MTCWPGRAAAGSVPEKIWGASCVAGKMMGNGGWQQRDGLKVWPNAGGPFKQVGTLQDKAKAV